MRYIRGDHVAPDLARGIDLLKGAATLGDPNAQQQLGAALLSGQGVAKDVKAAVSWYEKAAELDQPGALNDLSVIYWQGKLVPKDAKKAFLYGERLARRGSVPHMQLASFAADELGDLDAGERWIRAFSEHATGKNALYWFDWCRKHGRGDRAAAAALGEKGIDELERDDAKTCEDAAFAYLNLGKPEKALPLLRKLTETGDDAFLNLELAVATTDPAERTKALERGAKETGALGSVARLLADAWREKGELDPAALDKLLTGASAKDVGNVRYFAGRSFELTGKRALARSCYEAVVATKRGSLNEDLAADGLARLAAAK